VCKVAGDEFNHHQDQRDQQCALDDPIPPLKVAVAMRMTVAVAMTVAVHMNPRGNFIPSGNPPARTVTIGG